MGLIGFYIRVDGATLGTLEDSIYVDKNTNVGRYILSTCLQCFEGKQGYPTLKSCVDNSIYLLEIVDNTQNTISNI